MAGLFGGHSFGFLFRRDEGTIDRRTWWINALALAVPLALMTLVWNLIGEGAHRVIDTQSQLLDARTGFTYLYLLVFAAAILLAAVSYYNLSSKRFRARSLQPGLAGILPFCALITGAVHWMVPRVGDALPGWATWAVDAGLLAVLVWNMWELGVRR